MDLLILAEFHTIYTQQSSKRAPHSVFSKWKRILLATTSIWDSSNSVLRRCTTVVGAIPCWRRWCIYAMPWKFIGFGRYIQKYFCCENLYGRGRDRITPIFNRIPMYRQFSMLLLCGFMMVVVSILYDIDLRTVLWIISHVRLHMKVLSAIFLTTCMQWHWVHWTLPLYFRPVFLDIPALSGNYVDLI